MNKKKLLILGGSTEGFLLAEKVNQKFHDTVETITSFAGITKKRRSVIGESRVGGFGGVSGLTDFLQNQNISFVIDATHPFATTMKQNAWQACQKALAIKLLHIERPPWQAKSDDQWLMAGDMAQAAHCLNGFAKEQRVFLAIGRKEISAFKDCSSISFVARVIDPPNPKTILPNIDYIIERGPFDLAAERALFKRNNFAAVVCKNSGGMGAYAKLQAAREHATPVIMVQRPFHEKGQSVKTVEEAMTWLEMQF